MVWVSGAIGLAILLVAGDLLVRGAVNAALRLGLPPLLVSLTIVAFGTSAPELLVSVRAVLDDAPGLALGNVVGSNTANVLLVLGLPALISRLHTAEFDTRRVYVTMIAVSLLFIAACLAGPIGRWQGAGFLAILAAILAFEARTAVAARRGRAAAPPEGADPAMPGLKVAAFLALGLAGLPLGAEMLVAAALDIAREVGVSDSVVGLTLVAVGTSLPELATTVMAAVRRQADIALGNVIGSNIFNILGIVGIASLVGPIPVAPGFLAFDLWAMLAAALVIAPFVFTDRVDLTRRWGFLLTSLYVFYVVMVVRFG